MMDSKKRHDKIKTKGKGNFSFVIPLSHIFGFCEDYKKKYLWSRIFFYINKVWE